ncbi:MAG: hypothetical protein JKY48_08085 [Flavobacteriales bacterium]|nr:hypothetical protein [Flavobacteriales bacterium]
MIELPFPYLNELASQTIFISAFLGGFSASILGTLIVSKRKGRALNILVSGTSVSAIAFIVAVFAMTKLMMMTIPGYPFEVIQSELFMPRIIGVVAFFIGIMALLFVMGASGWLQSKKLGVFTTIIGSIGLLLTILFI